MNTEFIKQVLESGINNWDWDVKSYNLAPDESDHWSKKGYLFDMSIFEGIRTKYEKQYGIKLIQSQADEGLKKLISLEQILKKMEIEKLPLQDNFRAMVESYSWWKWNNKPEGEKEKEEILQILSKIQDKFFKEWIKPGENIGEIANSIFSFDDYIKSINIADGYEEEIEDDGDEIDNSYNLYTIIYFCVVLTVDSEVCNGGWSQCLQNEGGLILVSFIRAAEHFELLIYKEIAENILSELKKVPSDEWKLFAKEGGWTRPDGTTNPTALIIDIAGQTNMRGDAKASYYDLNPTLTDLITEQALKCKKELLIYLKS